MASAKSRAWQRLRRNRTAQISTCVIVLLMFGATVGPSLLQDPGFNIISPHVLQPPSSGSLLGTDELGRSLLTEMVYGIRTSLSVGLLSAASAAAIGILIGATAGFAGGRFDALLMRFAEMFQVMPTFILASVIVAMAGPGSLRVVAVIALLSWPQMARLVRGEVLRVKTLEFVDAARCLGWREQSILWSEVVPNSLAPAMALGTLVIGQAILLEAGLGFFGLTTPDVPSWGRMLNSGQRFFYQAWWLSLFPGLSIMLTVLAFNMFGDAVRHAFDPRSKEART
jgi:peptide/nickel transport system permease protein